MLRRAGLRSRNSYERLPTPISHLPLRRAFLPRRRLATFCTLLIFTYLCIFLLLDRTELRRIALEFWYSVRYSGSEYPPLYEEFYEIERSYPQHNASLPFPEGENGRFLWVSQHHSVGWNNVLQTIIMLTQIAYLSNRAYVLEPYAWNSGPEKFTTYNGHLIPSRIPLSALIEGSIAGASFPEDQPNPRFVSVEFFNQVCPKSRRKIISIEEWNKGLSWRPSEVLEIYSSRLLSMNESCVELYGGTKDYPFDWKHFGDSQLEEVVPSLLRSPILRDFKWSSLVLSAVRRNARHFAPELTAAPLPHVVPDLMAIHVRRGDFSHHCHHLAKWSSTFMGWAQWPGLPDVFTPPPGGRPGRNTPENVAIYMRHCFPEIPEIVSRVEQVRYEWETRNGKSEDEPRLRRLYILTNGKKEWVEELKHLLRLVGDWDVIYSSRDMNLIPEQKYIAQAIDQAIAERAAVFLGNGGCYADPICDISLSRTSSQVSQRIQFCYAESATSQSTATVSGDDQYTFRLIRTIEQSHYVRSARGNSLF